VGSLTEKGSVGEVAGCSVSERHDSHRGHATRLDGGGARAGCRPDGGGVAAEHRSNGVM
jgi:hypothetical protein